MTRFMSAATTVGLLALAASAAFGQPQDHLATHKALDRLERALQSEASLSPETKGALQDLVDALRAEREHSPETGPAAAPPTAGPSALDIERAELKKSVWEEVFERLKVSGDLRLRYEGSFVSGSKDRNRFRLRFRLRASYQLTDEVLLGAGIRTGNRRNPNSPYVTLGDGFNGLEISFDQAYVDYRPNWLEGSWLIAGKFVNPVVRNPVYGELVWDLDVNPEGLVLGWTRATNGVLRRFDAMVAGYTVFESGAVDDVWLLFAQVAGRFAATDDIEVLAAVSYNLYSEPIRLITTATPGPVISSRGNLVVDTNGDMVPDTFVSGFGIVHPLVAVTWNGWVMPLTISGELMWNHLAATSDDLGWAAGIKLGRTEKKGDWLLFYQSLMALRATRRA